MVAQQFVNQFVEDELLKNANVSLLFKNLNTEKIIASYNANKSFVPASTMKLITTATFIEKKDRNYRFITRLEYDGVITLEGVLRGNLYIRGGYDPTLGSEKIGDRFFLDKWVEKIKSFGIRKIEGNIILLKLPTEKITLNPKWLWEDIGNYYAAGVHRIAYKDNTYRLTLKSGAIGTTPQIVSIAPPMPNLVFENHLTATKTKTDNAYIYGSPDGLKRKIIGEIPAHQNAFVIKGDIPHPDILLAKDLAWKLKSNKITVNEAQIQTDNNIKYLGLHTHYSPPLYNIITEINTNSNNLYAEHLYRAMLVECGTDVIRKYWKAKGLPTDEYYQYDGSGLSPVNAVSTQFLVDLLSEMEKSLNFKDFKSSLALAGKSGTLRWFLKNTPLEGKVRAKSGSFDRVLSYAGYIDLKGELIAFAIVVNNANGTKSELRRKIEKLLLNIVNEHK